jgi:hypothetical protein
MRMRDAAFDRFLIWHKVGEEAEKVHDERGIRHAAGKLTCSRGRSPGPQVGERQEVGKVRHEASKFAVLELSLGTGCRQG